VVKINFHGGKNQFFSPVTRVNFRAGYACTGSTRSQQGSLHVSPGKKLIFTTVEIDFYRRGNCLSGKLRAYLITIVWRSMWFGTSLVPGPSILHAGLV